MDEHGNIESEAIRLRALAIELDQPVEQVAARQLIIYRTALAETRRSLAEVTSMTVQ